MPRRFNWDDLQYFLAVARSGTISQAGRRLDADHATVGRRVAALEEALGAKLFERTAKGYVLTAGGEQLLGAAARMEEQAIQAERELAGPGHVVSGTVRIGTLEGFANFFLAQRIGDFAKAHPSLALELTAIQQIVALSRREADITVTVSPPKDGRFVCERLTDYNLFVYGSPDYLAQADPIRSRADLSRHRFVGYIDDLVFMRGLNYLPEVGDGLTAQLQSSSLHAQMEAVVTGYGLCVLPAFIGRTRPDIVPVLPQNLVLRRAYWMISHADVAEIARVRLVRRFIREAVEASATLFADP